MLFILILKNFFWSLKIINLFCKHQNFLYGYIIFYLFIFPNIIFCDSFIDSDSLNIDKNSSLSKNQNNEDNVINKKLFYTLIGLSVVFIGIFVFLYFNNDNIDKIFDLILNTENNNNSEIVETNKNFNLKAPKGKIDGFQVIQINDVNSPFYKTFWKKPIVNSLTISIPNKEFYILTPDEMEQASKEAELRHFQKELEGFFYSGGPNEKGPYGDSDLSLDEIENLTLEECYNLERQWEIKKEKEKNEFEETLFNTYNESINSNLK
jgi:hypothetical protein